MGASEDARRDTRTGRRKTAVVHDHRERQRERQRKDIISAGNQSLLPLRVFIHTKTADGGHAVGRSKRFNAW